MGEQSLISCTKGAFLLRLAASVANGYDLKIFDIPGLVWDLLTVSDTAPGMNPRMRVARGTKKRTNLVFLRASCE
jgi:hypothetical protein